jgi:hypothetical protein
LCSSHIGTPGGNTLNATDNDNDNDNDAYTPSDASACVPFGSWPLALTPCRQYFDNPPSCYVLVPDDFLYPQEAVVEDVVPIILSYCGAKTLCSCAAVSRLWCAIAGRDEFWSILCKEKFGVEVNEIYPPPDPAKLLYILTHKSLQEVFRTRHTTDGSDCRSLVLRRSASV